MKGATVIPLLLLSLATLALAQVPAKNQFRYVNQGEYGDYITEYGGSYRLTDIFESPFHLAWYNTTPGEYFIGLRLGIQRNEPLYRWVWDANRGRPVGENATLSFARDGNLVLAEADGKVVWSTGTANKGAVGIRLLPNGNLVIYDKKGKFLWQSFEHPSDTLLVGQSLFVGGPTKLVSRHSESDNSDGSFSFELEKDGLNLYVLPVTASPKPLRYSDDSFQLGAPLNKVTFEVEAVNDGAAYELRLNNRILTRPKYNATYSYLRLQIDGNLAVYTYYEPVDYQPTQKTYSYFSDDGDLSSCGLPTRCGDLGVCDEGMCVACPTAKGLLGWSKSCQPPRYSFPCKPGFIINYAKVAGVEHFIPKYNKGLGKVKLESCKSKCTADCSCLGFFFYEESSQCWLAPVLGPLQTTTNTSHAVYLKYA